MVNIRTRSTSIPQDRVPYAFNSLLPPDIRVIGCEEVALEFHARFDALAKQYVYRIDNRQFPVPIATALHALYRQTARCGGDESGGPGSGRTAGF